MDRSDFDDIPSLPEMFGPARQIAYIVDNIDDAIELWQSKFDVGPFLVTRNAAPLTNARYRGEKAEKTHVNIAFAYIGDMQLELIELLGNTPSLYKEAIDAGLKDVHHYAVCVEDFDECYDHAMTNGYGVIVDSGIEGMARMSYLENLDQNLIIELIEWNALTRPYFDGISKMIDGAPSKDTVVEFKLSELTPVGTVIRMLPRLLINKILGR